MSQSLAFANAWNLATTLMVCVVVFKLGTGGYGIMEATEYDGDATAIVHEFDPQPAMRKGLAALQPSGGQARQATESVVGHTQPSGRPTRSPSWN